MSLTDLLIIAFAVVALGVDGVLLAIGGEPDTVSWRLALWSRRYPIVAVLSGILIGHLFWPNRGYCP